MKVGNIRVFSWGMGLCKPTAGPLWYFSWVPKCGCMIFMGGVLVFMTLSSPEKNWLSYTSWGLIAIEVLMYWILCYSFPGIPEQILRACALKEAGDVPDNQAAFL